MMESSYGSGTPTILSWQDDVTSTGLSSVPQGAFNLYQQTLAGITDMTHIMNHRLDVSWVPNATNYKLA